MKIDKLQFYRIIHSADGWAITRKREESPDTLENGGR